MTTTVRVDDRVHSILSEIAADEHRSLGQVIASAIELYRKEQFWKGVQDDFARLQADPVAWKGYQDEAALWDATASDGLENEEPYYSPEEEAEIDAEYARTYGG